MATGTGLATAKSSSSTPGNSAVWRPARCASLTTPTSPRSPTLTTRAIELASAVRGRTRLCARSPTSRSLEQHDFVLTPGRYVGAAEAEADHEPIEDKPPDSAGDSVEEFSKADRLKRSSARGWRGWSVSSERWLVAAVLYDRPTIRTAVPFDRTRRETRPLPVIKIAELNGGSQRRPGGSDGDLDPRHQIAPGDLLFSWSGLIVIQRWRGSSRCLEPTPLQGETS